MKKIIDFFRDNKKKIEKWLLIALISFLMAMFLFDSSPARKVSVEYSEQLNLDAIQLSGIVRDENGYRTTNDDPQMWLPLTDKVINDVCITFTEKLGYIGAGLYHSTDGVLTAQSCVYKNISNSKEVYFTIPDGVYNILRFDMEGIYDIESITVSYVTDMREYTLYTPNTSAMIFTLIVVVIVGVLMLFFREKTLAALGFLKDKLFSTEDSKDSRDPRRMANVFFAFAIIFGLLFIFLGPPFSCADEQAHYINVCRVSHGQIFAKVENGTPVAVMYQNEIDFIKSYAGKYNGILNERFNYNTMYELSHDTSVTYETVLGTEFVNLNPSAYLVPAAAVSFVRYFQPSISPYTVMTIAKIANLILYAFIIRWALLKTAAMRNTMFVLALMPMSLYQGASLSYDSPLIAAAFLLFAYATKILMSDENYRIGIEDIIAICTATLFLAGTKVAYALLILLLLTISIKKFGSLKKYFTCIGCVAAVVVIFYLVPTLVNGAVLSDVTYSYTPLQDAQKEYFFANLDKLPTIINKTIEANRDFWIENFFGILSWLDTSFPAAMVFAFLAFSTVIAVFDVCSTKGIKLSTRFANFISTAAIVVGTIVIMYIEWNPRASDYPMVDVAYGVQGRYFIPIAMFVLMIFANGLFSKLKCRDKVLATGENVSYAVCGAYLAVTAALLLVRFWIPLV